MQIDEVAYLDQLHERALDESVAQAERERCKRRFLDNVFLIWPEVSAAFNDDKHSL